MPRSPELDVMLSPASAWRQLAKTPPAGYWLTRPLLVALTLGCAVSIMCSGRLTLRLAVPVALCATFVPILQIASLAIVCHGIAPLGRTVDLFFAGHAPWTLWVIGSAIIWGLLPPATLFPYGYRWRLSAIVIFTWSAYIDFQFFHQLSPHSAVRRLLAQRTICWIPGLLIFVAPAGWQVFASMVGI